MSQNDHPSRHADPDARLRQRIASANPLPGADVHAGALRKGLDELGRAIVSAPPGRRRRRFRWPAVAGTAGIASVLVTGVAFAGMYTTHTGIFPKRGTENDATELLRVDAPDFPAIVRTTVRDIPFPPGDGAEARVPIYLGQFAAQRRRDGSAGAGATVQTGHVRSTFTLWGICAWRGYWLQEHRDGTPREQRAAADGFARIARSISDGGRDTEFAPVYLRVARNQAAGDPSASAEFEGFYRVNCADEPRPWEHR